MDFENLRHVDPVKRSAEKQSAAPEYSPMNPPDAYSPPAADPVAYEAMPEFLRGLMDDHGDFQVAVESLEEALTQLRQNGFGAGRVVDERLRGFFTFLDDRIVGHNLKEEKILFPVLHERLLEKGEHGRGESRRTAVDMLEDDHIRVMQLAAVTFNFLGLASRLADARARAIVLDAALEQGSALVELMRLHVFREENVVFALAVKHLSSSDFDNMRERAARYGLR
ncbi:MAG: hemerythrin domain-containing protein [Candidatus Krumholzibacteriia bacterium]